MGQSRVWVQPSPRILAYVGHIALASIFFSNFILFQQILIGSTDALGINVPLLYLAKRQFLAGDWGIWSSTISGGVSSYLIAVAPLFSPSNWLHFLVTDSLFFYALTLFAYLKLIFVGILAYEIFSIEIKDKRWAFFCSACYQLCGYTIWSTMFYDGLGTIFFLMISVYLTWTFERRPAWRSFLQISLSLICLMMEGNLLYCIYSMMFFSLLVVYRSMTGNLKGRKPFLGIVFFAVFCAGLVAMFRILPTMAEMKGTTRDLHHIEKDFRDFSFLSLRMFIPEVFGVCYRQSIDFFSQLDPSLKGAHFHSLMPQFFGVLPLLIALWGLMNARRGKLLFWSIYSLGLFSLLIFVKPLDLAARILGHGVYHSLSLHVLFPFGFCLLLAQGCRFLSEGKCRNFTFRRAAIGLSAILGAVWIYSSLVWGVYLGSYIRWFILAMLGGLMAIALAYFLLRQKSPWLQNLVNALAIILLVLGGAVLLFVGEGHLVYLSHVKILGSSFIFLGGGYLNLRVKSDAKRRIGLGVLGGLLTLVMVFPWANQPSALTSSGEDLVLAALGGFRFLFISVLFLNLIFIKQRNRQYELFPLCLLVLLGDLLPAAKIHSFAVINPFYQKANPFSANPASTVNGTRLTDLDLKNYRINDVNHALNFDLLGRIPQSSNSLAYALYGARSAGGYINAVSLRYAKLFLTLEPGSPDPMRGVNLRVQNERLKDLLGVRYDFDESKNRIIEREGALARWMFFPSYEKRVAAENILDRIQSEDFSPQHSLLVEGEHLQTVEGGKSFRLKPTQESSDRIDLKINPETSGMVFFGDGYNAGWVPYVDGIPAKLLRVNYAFMGVEAEPGQHEISFRFEPPAVRTGMRLSLLGLIIVFFVTVTLATLNPTFSVRLLGAFGHNRIIPHPK